MHLSVGFLITAVNDVKTSCVWVTIGPRNSTFQWSYSCKLSCSCEALKVREVGEVKGADVQKGCAMPRYANVKLKPHRPRPLCNRVPLHNLFGQVRPLLKSLLWGGNCLKLGMHHCKIQHVSTSLGSGQIIFASTMLLAQLIHVIADARSGQDASKF